MSKSLTINAPQIVQTRNTLNAVPSGSTAEPDYSVKFVPQDLTEAQQAQARQNIGAVSASEVAQADWDQTDTTAPDYIKNKPEISNPFPFFGNNNMLVIKSDRQTTFKTGGKFLDIWRNGVYEHLGSESDNIKSVTISAGINYIKAAGLGSEEFQDKNGNYVLYTPCVNTPLKINDTYTGSIKLISTILRAPDHQCQTNNVIHILLNNYAQMTMSRLSTYTFTYVFTDTSFNIQWSGEIPSTVSATFYVPRNRYNQFVNLVNTQYPNDDTSVILNKVIVYDFIEWLDFEPVIKTYNAVPLTMTDANGNVITGDFIVYNLSITPAV